MTDHTGVQRIHGYCALCIARCGTVATVEDGRFTRLDPDHSHPTGRAICAKGRAAPELVYHPERLTSPRRAVHVTTADVMTYITQRQAAGAKNATINREFAALKRAYSLGLAAERIHRAPRLRMLQEHNVRQGFFEREQMVAVRGGLPEHLRGLITTAFITGWRIQSELLTLQWRQVDFAAGTLRLEPGTTKNREGRVFVMTPELRATLEAQRAAMEAVQRKRGMILPWVSGEAHCRIPEGVGEGVRAGGRPGAHPARSPAVSGPEPGAGRRAALGGDEDGRPQDGGHLPTLRHRGRGHAPGGG
jgi:integrase